MTFPRVTPWMERTAFRYSLTSGHLWTCERNITNDPVHSYRCQALNSINPLCRVAQTGSTRFSIASADRAAVGVLACPPSRPLVFQTLTWPPLACPQPMGSERMEMRKRQMSVQQESAAGGSAPAEQGQPGQQAGPRGSNACCFCWCCCCSCSW